MEDIAADVMSFVLIQPSRSAVSKSACLAADKYCRHKQTNILASTQLLHPPIFIIFRPCLSIELLLAFGIAFVDLV